MAAYSPVPHLLRHRREIAGARHGGGRCLRGCLRSRSASNCTSATSHPTPATGSDRHGRIVQIAEPASTFKLPTVRYGLICVGAVLLLLATALILRQPGIPT
jgi:hypothetical protein